MEILAHTNGDLHFQKVALFVKIKWMFGDILAKKIYTDEMGMTLMNLKHLVCWQGRKTYSE